MSVSRQLWRGTAFVSGASILARVGTFLTSLAIVRLLGLDAVGQLGLIEGWLNVFLMFALVGMDFGIPKFVAQEWGRDNQKVGGIAAVSLLVGAATSLLVGGVVWLALVSGMGQGNTVVQLLQPYAGWMVGLVVLSALRQIVTGIIYGLQTFPALVSANITVGALSFPLSFWLVKEHQLQGALMARVLLLMVELGWLSLSMFGTLRRGGASLHLHNWRAQGRELWTFGLPTFIGQLATNPVQPFMMSLLAAQPGGVGQVALITIAMRLVSLVQFFPGAMSATLTPVLSSEWATGDRERFRQGTLTALRMCWLCALPITVFFLAASPGALRHLYGLEFVAAWPITFWMLLASLLASLNLTADRSFIAAGRVWLSTGNTFVWLALFLPLSWWLTPAFRAMGYTIAYTVSVALYVLLQMWWLHRLFAVRVQAMFGVLGISLLLVIASWQVASLQQSLLAVALTIGCVVLEARYFLSEGERKAFATRFQGLQIVQRLSSRFAKA